MEQAARKLSPRATLFHIGFRGGPLYIGFREANKLGRHERVPIAGADLENANHAKANLIFADLTKADLTLADLTDATLWC